MKSQVHMSHTGERKESHVVTPALTCVPTTLQMLLMLLLSFMRMLRFICTTNKCNVANDLHLYTRGDSLFLLPSGIGLFQWNNAVIHKTIEKIALLIWCPNSPDFNSIKYLCSLVCKEIRHV